MSFAQPPGATPLDEDAMVGLRVSARTQEELNRFEAAAIEEGRLVAFRNPRMRRDFPSDANLRWLHKRMFADIWTWAGRYRTTDTNIGVPWEKIAVSVHDLCADMTAQQQAQRDLDEFSLWFHHRLVSIHPFLNGNGRHARLATDILRRNFGLSKFTWGANELVSATEIRSQYISALQSADRGDLGPLLKFAHAK